MSNIEQRDELATITYLSGYPDPASERIQPLAERAKWEQESHYGAADAILAAGYAKVDHIEYAASHKHAGLDVTDEDGDLFTDLDGTKWLYEEYPNVTLMQRTVGPWVPLEPEAEAKP